MSLRVAFDLDGVLADMGLAYTEIARHLISDGEGGVAEARGHGTSRDDTDEDECPPDEGLAGAELSSRQQRRVWRRIRSTTDFWTTLQPLEAGVVSCIDDLTAQYGWDTFFVTVRPATSGDTVQRQTQRWLAKQGFALPSVIAHAGSRGQLADALGLDFLVDDSVQHCVNVIAESKAKPILVQRAEDAVTDGNAKRLGIEVCRSVAGALHILVRATELKDRPSFMSRVKKTVGL